MSETESPNEHRQMHFLENLGRPKLLNQDPRYVGSDKIFWEMVVPKLFRALVARDVFGSIEIGGKEPLAPWRTPE